MDSEISGGIVEDQNPIIAILPAAGWVKMTDAFILEMPQRLSVPIAWVEPPYLYFFP